MAGHLAGEWRDASWADFERALHSKLQQGGAGGGGGGGGGQGEGMLVAEAGGTADVALLQRREAAAGDEGGAACPSGEHGSALWASSLGPREMLPATAVPSVEAPDELDGRLVYERRVEASSLVWAAEDAPRLGSGPLPPRRAVDLVPPTDTWDVWRTPAEAERRADEDGGAGAPEFVEVLIDDEMLAVGAESSSLRRIPAGKEFQLKGSSQNTPFRPGGFEALSGIDLSDPAQAAAEIQASLDLLDFSQPEKLLSVPPGFDPAATDFTRIFDADFDPAAFQAEQEAKRAQAERAAQLEAEEWAAKSAAKAEEEEEELRVDPSDGNAYSLGSFYEAYGPEQGQFLWEEAGRLMAEAEAQVSSPKAARPPKASAGAPPAPAPAPGPAVEGVKVDLKKVFVDDDDDDSDGWSDEDDAAATAGAIPTIAPAVVTPRPMTPAPSAAGGTASTAAPTTDAGGDAEDEMDLDTVLSKMAEFHKREKATEAKAEETVWAHPGGADMSNFRELVPEMAIEYPFELDDFQKEAIAHLEQNENVFVAAHTSAGKTVVAEYGIAMAFQHLTKAIYTSPIKTLSNQKYREFVETFGADNVGIVTGDVSINPSANVVIMTTEILRSMLYKGSDLIRDVEWVIFDEVHYLNDEERGVVWEEVIIMLPDHVSMIMLSATVPNTMEVANWIGRTKKKKVTVVSTMKRPVPLEHYILAKGKMFKLMDAKGTFLSDQLKEAVKDDKAEKDKAKASGRGRGADRGGRGGGRGGGGRGKDRGGKSYTRGGGGGGPNRRGGRPPGPAGRDDPQFWKQVIDFLNSKEVLPVVIFTFGKHKCESCGYGLGSTDLTTKAEKAEIEAFVNNSIRRLSPGDRQIPQILRIKELLKRGIGVHHAGLLPIIKEVVEMLFGQTLIKVLFATETFAMGVNMPTRTVIFNGIRKNDGKGFRELLAGEYTQMSGRAGRRGLDTVGLVFLSVGDGEAIPAELNLRTMMKGRSTLLTSQFRLTYNMILNLLRVEDLKVEDMIKRSFSEFDSQKDSGEVERLLLQGRRRLDKQQLLYEQFLQSSTIAQEFQLEVEQFHDFSKQLADLNYAITLEIKHKAPERLQTGRVVVCRSRVFGLAVGVLLYDGRKTATELAEADTLKPKSGAKLSMAALMSKKPEPQKQTEAPPDAELGESSIARALLIQPFGAGSSDSGAAAAAAAAVSKGDASAAARCQRICGHLCEFVELKPSDLVSVTADVLDVDKAELGGKSGPSGPGVLEEAVQQLLALAEAAPDGLPPPLSARELKIAGMEFVEAYSARNHLAEQVRGVRCWRSATFAEHYRHVHKIATLRKGMAALKHANSDQSLYLMPEFQKRLDVLRSLQYIDEEETVLLKGRVACEVTSSESLLVTELVFQNVLADLTPEECVSLLSCLVFQETVKYEVTLTPTLDAARKQLFGIAEDLARRQIDMGLKEIDPKEYVKELVHDGMMEACYEWARGVPFVSITKLTDVFEGSIVRCISRLDELCRMVKNGARIAGSLGDSQLYAKMELASQLIKRDIVFAASLYVN